MNNKQIWLVLIFVLMGAFLFAAGANAQEPTLQANLGTGFTYQVFENPTGLDHCASGNESDLPTPSQWMTRIKRDAQDPPNLAKQLHDRL